METTIVDDALPASSESSALVGAAQPSFESSVSAGTQATISNSFESSVVGGGALPFKYLLPTPHHNSNETNNIQVRSLLQLFTALAQVQTAQTGDNGMLRHSLATLEG